MTVPSVLFNLVYTIGELHCAIYRLYICSCIREDYIILSFLPVRPLRGGVKPPEPFRKHFFSLFKKKETHEPHLKKKKKMLMLSAGQNQSTEKCQVFENNNSQIQV